MKKAIRIITGLVIVGLLIFGIYKVFIDCERTNTFYDKYFTLDEMDYAVLEDELIVKLLDIKDNRCLDADCDREGQYLGTLEPTSFKLEKISLEYTLNLIRVDENGATLTVTPNVEEE